MKRLYGRIFAYPNKGLKIDKKCKQRKIKLVDVDKLSLTEKS